MTTRQPPCWLLQTVRRTRATRDLTNPTTHHRRRATKRSHWWRLLRRHPMMTSKQPVLQLRQFLIMILMPTRSRDAHHAMRRGGGTELPHPPERCQRRRARRGVAARLDWHTNEIAPVRVRRARRGGHRRGRGGFTPLTGAAPQGQHATDPIGGGSDARPPKCAARPTGVSTQSARWGCPYSSLTCVAISCRPIRPGPRG